MSKVYYLLNSFSTEEQLPLMNTVRHSEAYASSSRTKDWGCSRRVWFCSMIIYISQQSLLNIPLYLSTHVCQTLNTLLPRDTNILKTISKVIQLNFVNHNLLFHKFFLESNFIYSLKISFTNILSCIKHLYNNMVDSTWKGNVLGILIHMEQFTFIEIDSHLPVFLQNKLKKKKQDIFNENIY